MTAPLTALLERVEAADGPDVKLDIAIVMAIYPDIGAPAPHCIGDEPIFWHDPYRKQPPPLLTSSVDAALALVERVLPGLGIVVCRIAGKPGLMQIREAFVFDECVDIEIEPDGWWRIRPAALAIVECLLRALHALASRDAAGPADAEGV